MLRSPQLPLFSIREFCYNSLPSELVHLSPVLNLPQDAHCFNRLTRNLASKSVLISYHIFDDFVCFLNCQPSQIYTSNYSVYFLPCPSIGLSHILLIYLCLLGSHYTPHHPPCQILVSRDQVQAHKNIFYLMIVDLQLYSSQDK